MMEDSEEEPVCPLCLEELDLTDRHFKPCQCGYQICLWCWHQIMEMAEGEGKCPACRTPYDKNKVTEASQALPEDLTGLISEKKQKDRQSKASVSASRQHLSSVRVVQRNLVYVIGLPLNIAEEDILRTNQYFGQYGKIHKISTSRSAAYNAASGPNGPTASAYVNFVREEDAVKCIQAVDGALLEGKLIRACFGTTKYCNSYLKHVPCTNPDCLYLHDIGSHDDSFTKEEMLASKQDYFHNATHPSNYSGKGLPPPPSEASGSSAARPLNIPSTSQQPHREGSATGGSPGPQAALAASSSWGSKNKVTGPAAAAKVLPVAAPPPALKALRPAAGGSAGPSSSAAPPPSTSASAAGTSGPGKGSFTSHKPSAAVLSGRVINANAQPPPFIAVASRNVDAPGVGTAKTVSAAQAAAAAALAGRPVTPGDTAGASSAKGGRPVAPADTVGAPGAKAGRPVTPAETLGASSLKPGLDPTPKQAAAVLAARTSKVGRQVVVASEGPTAGSAAPSVIKTLGTGPIRQGSFVAVAKAAAGVSLGAGSKLVLEGALSASGPSPLAGESFPTLQAVISQSNSRPSSADTGPGKQPRAHLEKGGLQSDESAGGSAAGGLGAWGKSLVKTSSGLAAESIAAESRGPEKVGQVGTGAKTANGGSDNKQNAEAGLPTSTSRASETTAPAETAPAPGTLKDVLSKSPANRAGSLRIARTEAERASLESTSGFHFERSAEIPVSRRSSHGDEGLLRAVTGFGSGTGVFVPGFLNQDTLSRSSSPQPAGTGVFLPGLSRTSSGGGGSPSWGGIGRGMLQERGGGMLDQGGSPKFNRLLGMNMEGGSPRMFRQGSPFEGGSPKFFHQGGGVGSPNYGRLGPGYLEGGSPKFGRVGPFQGEGGSPAYGRANGGQMMGMLEMANFGRPPGGHFNSLVEGGSPSFARPAMSAPVSRLARLGGPAGDAETAAEGSRKMEQNALGGAKESGAGLKEPGFEQLRRLRTGNPRQEEPAKKEPGSPGESSVIADILGMEFDPWADGPLPDPSGLAKILLAEERAKAAAAAAKTSTPGAPPARQSRFKFAWESDGPTEEPASEGGVRKSRFDFAGSSDTVPTPADSAMVSSSAGVKSRFGFTLEKDKGGVDTARPGTAGSSGAGSDAGGRFSPAPGLTTSESSETSSRPQSGSRPSTAEDDGNVNGARFGGGIVRPGSASGKPLLPAPPGFVNRGRGGAPAGSQGLLPTPPPFSMRPSHAPLGGAQPQPPAPPPNPDMGFFDPAIMAMGTGKAFEYKPPPPSSSPNEAMSPGLLSILKNLGGPPSSNPPNGGEGFPNPGSGLPFFPPPSGQKTPPVRQQGFGGLAGPAFQPPLQSEQYSQVVTSSGKDSGHENGKGEASGSRPGSGGVVPRSPGVWGLGEAPAAQMGKDPAPQMRAQRGGLSSMMAAIGGPGTHATAPSFASAVAASQGANPPGFGVGGVPGANNPGQSSWAAIAAVKTPSAAKQHPPEAEKRGAREGGRVDGASKEREVIKQGEMGSEGFGKVEKRGAEEKETQVWVEVGEGSDGGQEEGEEDAGKVLNEEEEKKALRKKEKKLRREREKALAAERKQKEAEEGKAREKAASKKEKGATEKEPAPAPVSKPPEALLAKAPAANGKSKKESGTITGPETKVELEADEKKGEGSKKGVEKQNGTGKKRKDALALDDLGKNEKLGEGGEPILQFAKGSDGGAKSPIKEKSKIGLKARVQDEKKSAGFESDAVNAAGFLASLVNEKKGVNLPVKGKRPEAIAAKPDISHQEKRSGENKAGSAPIGVPIGPFGMPVGANMVFGSGSTEFTAQGLGFNLSANQVFPQNWQGSNMNGMAEGIKAGLSLSALLQQQLELQLQQNQGAPASEGVGGKRSRGYGEAPAGGSSKDFGLPAAAARAAARVFRMAADFVMDDGSSSSGESFTTSAGNGRHGSVNGGAGFGVNNLPDVYQFSATSSAERAVAAAAAWEHGLRGPEAAVSNGNAHNPLLSQVDALEREVENAREVERKLENKLMEVKQWIDQDDAVLENITSSYAATAAEAKGAF